MSNKIAKIEQDAANFMKSVSQQLQTYAIRDYNNQAFAKSAMIAIVSSDKLQECLESDQGKASIVNALKMAAGTGLSLNPQEGKAALIPYGKKVNNKYIQIASYQVMKNGLIDLALESGKVEFITADTVREGDEFVIAKTMNGDEYEFRPHRKTRGEIDGFFAAVKMKAESPESLGVCHVKYMTLEEVTGHRKQFSERTQMPEEGYGQKTVLKKLLNNLHISQEVNNAIGGENAREEIDVTPTPVKKGTGADDLEKKLTEKTAEVKTEALDAEIVQTEPEQGQSEMDLNAGAGKSQKKDLI